MTDDYRKKISERLKGENNPMFGKFGKLSSHGNIFEI